MQLFGLLRPKVFEKKFLTEWFVIVKKPLIVLTTTPAYISQTGLPIDAEVGGTNTQSAARFLEISTAILNDVIQSWIMLQNHQYQK